MTKVSKFNQWTLTIQRELKLICHFLLQKIVIDGKGHLMGRLAAICAKQLLEGKELVVVRCEDILISGPFARNRRKLKI